MATKAARAKAILDALADPATVDAALITKVGDAFAYTYRRNETLTPTEKAGVFLQEVRKHIKEIVADAVRSQAAALAAQQAAADISIGEDEG